MTVLDASAVLALIHNEPGGDLVADESVRIACRGVHLLLGIGEHVCLALAVSTGLGWFATGCASSTLLVRRVGR